jgi:predicted nucleic acid-binding protein
MILDTTFLSALWRERMAGKAGPAESFLHRHRDRPVLTTVVNLAELAVFAPDLPSLTRFFRQFRVLGLHPGAAIRAGQLDRALIRAGGRLGEGDTLIAGIASYNRQPIVSNDIAFDRVPSLRRIPHLS